MTLEYAVWYMAAGCLPDSDEPLFVGTKGKCEGWIANNKAEFAESEGDYNTYDFVVEPYYDYELEEQAYEAAHERHRASDPR